MVLSREGLPPVDAARAYDAYATQYDSLLRENRINAYMRRELDAVLASSFPSGTRLLELGCGTGDEAIALAARNCEVVACDPSAKMIGIATRKARDRGLEGRVRFFAARARDLDGMSGDSWDRAPFDGAYASFSLSYEPDLAPVSRALGRRLRPSSPFVIAAMNRLCGVEWAASLAAGHPGLAGRRLRREAPHKVGAFVTSVFPRGVSETARAFRPTFRLEEVRALPLILPPAYANRAFVRWPGLLDLLERADPPVGRLPLMRLLGDHSVLRFRRIS